VARQVPRRAASPMVGRGPRGGQRLLGNRALRRRCAGPGASF